MLNINEFYFVLVSSIFFIIFILVSVAFLTLLERKKLASIQNRKGPNKVGFFGLLQPIVDGIKLLLKETIIPHNSVFFIFFLSPILAFSFGFIGWSLLPLNGFSFILVNLEYGFILVFIFSIFHVYSIILAGWSSNSKYSFLGSLRSAAQLIAYDISIGFILLTIFLAVKSFNIHKIVEFQINNGWLIFYYPILFIIFFICCLAETNRHPFDLPEAEAELVSGYNVEYSSIGFALFFLGEYASILFMSSLTVVLFFGGWDSIFNFSNHIVDYLWKIIFYFFKLSIIIHLFIDIRAAIPRYRYDQLMIIGWKILLPLTFSIFLLNVIIFYFCNLTVGDFDFFKIIF
jgi:NADH-quinone oxidoreductase subunit H